MPCIPDTLCRCLRISSLALRALSSSPNGSLCPGPQLWLPPLQLATASFSQSTLLLSNFHKTRRTRIILLSRCANLFPVKLSSQWPYNLLCWIYIQLLQWRYTTQWRIWFKRNGGEADLRIQHAICYAARNFNESNFWGTIVTGPRALLWLKAGGVNETTRQFEC